MNEWLKTECGEFKKSEIKGARLESLVLPKPNIGTYIMTLEYNVFWHVEVLVDRTWTRVTNNLTDKSEAQERLDNIMQEIKGGSNNE